MELDLHEHMANNTKRECTKWYLCIRCPCLWNKNKIATINFQPEKSRLSWLNINRINMKLSISSPCISTCISIMLTNTVPNLIFFNGTKKLEGNFLKIFLRLELVYNRSSFVTKSKRLLKGWSRLCSWHDLKLRTPPSKCRRWELHSPTDVDEILTNDIYQVHASRESRAYSTFGFNI